MAKEGITSEEIRKKISVLKEPESKVKYLQKILKKEKLLKPETRESVKEILSENYIKAGEFAEEKGDFETAFEMYEKVGTQESYMKAGEAAEKAGKFIDAAWMYEKTGMKKENACSQAARAAEKKEVWGVAALLYEMAGDFRIAGLLYDRAGMKKEKEVAFMKSGKHFENAGDFLEASESYEKVGTEEGFMKAGKTAEKGKMFFYAAHMYKQGGMEDAFIKLGKECEKAGKFYDAGFLYEKGENYDKAQECFNKSGIKKSVKKTLDSIVTSILTLGGLGTIFSFFSKPQIIGTMNIQQLAPPMPDYLPLVFLLCLVGGSVYFTINYFRKRKEYSIPLSF